MSKISDELREFAYLHFSGSENVGPCDALMGIADRIDAEMVELPKDADGVPVHVGDTVYTADGSEAYVARIDFVPDVPGVELRFPCGTISEYVPRYIYHTRPDSWERIADELERYANDSHSEDEIDGMTASTLVDFAERIRKLAKKEGKRCQ